MDSLSVALYRAENDIGYDSMSWKSPDGITENQKEFLYSLLDDAKLGDRLHENYEIKIQSANSETYGKLLAELKDLQQYDDPEKQYLKFIWTHENPLQWFNHTRAKSFFERMFKYS